MNTRNNAAAEAARAAGIAAAAARTAGRIEADESADEAATLTVDRARYADPAGGEYVARPVPGVAIDGVTDDVTLIRYYVTALGMSVLLTGEPGCGKSALSRAAFPDWRRESGSADRTAQQVIGFRDEDDKGKIVWRDAPLVAALRAGEPGILWDELSRDPGDVQDRILSVFDGTGSLARADAGHRDLPVPGGFAAVFTANHPERISPALLDRLVVHHVDTTSDTVRAAGVADQLVMIREHLAERDGGTVWRPSLRTLLRANRFMALGDRTLTAHAILGEPGIPSRDREAVHRTVSTLLGVSIPADGLVIR